MAAYTGDYAADKVRDKTAATVNKPTSKAAGKVDDAASSIVESGREALSGFKEVGGNVAYVVEDSVKNQPMVTIVIALGVGFVLGALWKT